MTPEEEVGSVGLNLAIFGAFVLATLVLVYRAGRTTRTASDYYAAGRGFTGPQNGVAIAGDYLVIVVVGTLMIFYVLVGGMKGTTYVQIIKAVLLLVGSAVMTAWVLGVVGLDLGELLERAAERSPRGRAPDAARRYAEMEVRALTGAGAERATAH